MLKGRITKQKQVSEAGKRDSLTRQVGFRCVWVKGEGWCTCGDKTEIADLNRKQIKAQNEVKYKDDDSTPFLDNSDTTAAKTCLKTFLLTLTLPGG